MGCTGAGDPTALFCTCKHRQMNKVEIRVGSHTATAELSGCQGGQPAFVLATPLFLCPILEIRRGENA
ncbi:MAG TPA: hypothetical protein DEF34_04225 [Desulfotomaculum sp.]|nr:MAG: hypothetical protein JL56_09880 [Desulfotomaculum sp. BICA1-6]HBX22834.1 hypothetical protein [Desulfotomaculum sp.]